MILDAFLQAYIVRGSSDVPKTKQGPLYRTVRTPLASLGKFMYTHVDYESYQYQIHVDI